MVHPPWTSQPSLLLFTLSHCALGHTGLLSHLQNAKLPPNSRPCDLLFPLPGIKQLFQFAQACPGFSSKSPMTGEISAPDKLGWLVTLSVRMDGFLSLRSQLQCPSLERPALLGELK